MEPPGVTQDDDGNDDRTVVGQWYASSFKVGQSAFEFKVDCGKGEFGQDGEPMTTVYFRVIASPLNARELFRLLGLGLLRYADTYGPIDDNGAGPAGSGT